MMGGEGNQVVRREPRRAGVEEPPGGWALQELGTWDADST